MRTTLSPLQYATKLPQAGNRLLVACYGFEQRSLGWAELQEHACLSTGNALIFRYKRPKGKNRINQLRKELKRLGVIQPTEVSCDGRYPITIEKDIESALQEQLSGKDEVVIDTSAMTKLLILACLCKLSTFPVRVRVVYSEAEDYAPTLRQYLGAGPTMAKVTAFPSRGVESIIRLTCLSSIRMQGQPTTMIAFASFNEQLVRHMLGSISPHRLLFINGRPPRNDYAWREDATQKIHQKLIDEYSNDNAIDANGRLVRSVSTLDYRETVRECEKIYRLYGLHERIIFAATGSKMQTVGLFIFKVKHPDVHIEYPTPDSYFVRGLSTGVRQVYEVVFDNFAEALRTFHADINNPGASDSESQP